MASKKNVVLEIGSNKYDLAVITQRAIEHFEKHNTVEIKDINVYIKPEDEKAYYTVNENQFNACIDL